MPLDCSAAILVSEALDALSEGQRGTSCTLQQRETGDDGCAAHRSYAAGRKLKNWEETLLGSALPQL